MRNSLETERIKCRINERFDSLFVKGQDNALHPHVCIVCDRMLKPKDCSVISTATLTDNVDLLSPTDWNAVNSAISACYKHQGETETTEDDTLLSSMLLSPRASYISRQDRRFNKGYTCCRHCKRSLSQNVMPKFAIANNYAFGTPPDCLLDLTDIELALLSPVKVYGYCFCYTGGMQKELKGSLSYYKVDINSIVRSVTHFEVLNMTSNIVVMLYGRMTPEQKRRAARKNQIRVSKVLSAMQWLLLYNEEWKKLDIDLDQVRESLRNPTLIDNSRLEESNPAASNIEISESFQVFFPDGTVSPTTGGQNNLSEFQEMIQAANRNGFDPQFRCDLLKEAVSDFKDNNLVNACLLQFPFGRGGMHEVRLKHDGSFTSSADISEYVQHLSLMSQRHFHQELFCLILYNLHVKQKMVRTASLRVRNKLSAQSIAEEITPEHISLALNSRQRRLDSTNRLGESFLKAVDTVTGSAPHTTEAAKRAKRNGEAMQHTFGLPHFFLTVTPDDDNSYVVQIYSDIVIDDSTPICEMSDEELEKRAKKRTELRLRHPGVCAFYFELALEIVLEEVLGWDLVHDLPREDYTGLFGEVIAFIASIEEQGRRTLHGHIQFWVDGFSTIRDNLHSENEQQRLSAATEIVERADKVGSTVFMGEVPDHAAENNNYTHHYARTFSHECCVPNWRRRSPEVVNDQELRNLRHRVGQHSKGGMFAYCPACTYSWTNTKLVESYLMNHVKVRNLSCFPDMQVRRLKAMAVEYQRSTAEDSQSIGQVVEAAYNLHVHNNRSCYNKTSSKKRSVVSREDECRYRFPQKRQRKTVVQNSSKDIVKWYCYDGSFEERHIKEVVVRRHKYDAFQNVSCRAISHSKLTCNTNIQVVMPGPIGQYTFKYIMKSTQKDDEEEYSRIDQAMKKVLSGLRRHESNVSESIRRVLVASFSHQKTNIVGSPMASFLTRNKARFLFSHHPSWCPLRDLKQLLEGNEIEVQVSQHKGSQFFQTAALHYLCRPLELEQCSPFDFYSKYEVVNVTNKTRDSLLPFHNSHFSHPSLADNRFLQGVRLRKTPSIVKVFQYDFADTAKFDGCLLDGNYVPNDEAESYCKHALLLFLNYRSPQDLLPQSSFTECFRSHVHSGRIRPLQLEFLQNIQDVKSNSFRQQHTEDSLERCTQPFLPVSEATKNQAEDENEEDTTLNGPALDNMIDLLLNESSNLVSHTDGNLPDTLTFASLRNKGTHRGGYDHIATLSGDSNNASIFVQPTHETTDDVNNANTENEVEMSSQRKPDVSDIVKLLLERTTRRHSNVNGTVETDTIQAFEANGSVESIFDWSRQAKLDRRQRRAFEILTATFVMSFYTEAQSDESRATRDQVFLKEKRKLETLLETRRRSSKQLILCLHGPGGSGKTTVIDLLVEYARNFCNNLDYRFTSRTIVVTAMSGVAATIIRGDTTHSAVYLNQKRPLDAEQIELWEETRMLIIDEISFASKEDFAELHRKLSCLRQNRNLPYGGLHIVFAGDFRQLEPVSRPHSSKKPVYSENCVEFKDWVNCYIELQGTHRFKDDPAWGALLLRFRNGTVTGQDIDLINQRVVSKTECLPQDIRYATYFNRDRDSINTALFVERCKRTRQQRRQLNDSLIVLCSNITVQDSSKVYRPFQQCKTLWQDCGEDDIKMRNGRMDPALKIYRGCRVMLTENVSVREGRANGTQAIVEAIVLKEGYQASSVNIDSGVTVQTVLATEVSHVVLRHCNNRIAPATFSIEPKQFSFKGRILKPETLSVKENDREPLFMKAVQLPIIVNNATTGHKLQGSGVDALFVHNWSYVTNWVYVMLSRVRTQKGLYARKELSKDLSKYQVPQSLVRMLNRLKERAPNYWNDDEYLDLFS